MTHVTTFILHLPLAVFKFLSKIEYVCVQCNLRTNKQTNKEKKNTPDRRLALVRPELFHSIVTFVLIFARKQKRECHVCH